MVLKWPRQKQNKLKIKRMAIEYINISRAFLLIIQRDSRVVSRYVNKKITKIYRYLFGSNLTHNVATLRGM